MTLPRRRWLLVPLALFAVVLGLCAAFGSSLYVTQAQISQLNEGMTLEDAEAILGRHDSTLGPEAGLVGGVIYFWETWTGNLALWVKKEKICGVITYRSPDQEGLWEYRLRRKLGW